MRRLLTLLPLVVVLAAAATSALAESSPLPVRVGDVAGLVPSRLAAQAGGLGDLTYHGGRVMRTNKVYAIYWLPSGSTESSRYQTLLNGFFSNVASASGKKTNVY